MMSDWFDEENMREMYEIAERRINFEEGEEKMKNKIIEELQRAGVSDDLIQLVSQE